MKRFFIILSFVLLFAGCKQASSPDEVEAITPTVTNPTTETPTVPEAPIISAPETDKPYYVKNSKWENFDIATLVKSSNSRAASALPSLDEALALVADYNAENNGDQLHLDTVDVPITEAPDVKLYYAKAVGKYYEIGEQYTFTREDYATHKQVYEQDAASRGYIVFVEKVPETVPVIVITPDTRTRHEKYSLYLVNKYNKIVVYEGYKYEQHIDEIWDSLDSETQAGYKNNIDNLMEWRIKAFNSETVCTTYADAPWRVEYGQIYTEPADPPVEP